MESKDLVANILSSLSLLVSILTAGLGFFYWRRQCREKAQDELNKAAQQVSYVKDSYRLTDVQFSVQKVADVLLHHKGTEHALWDFL